MLNLRNISKVFGGTDDGLASVPAVDDISIDVRAGEFFSIIGTSGCGKSTLLRIIGGLIPATGGELTVAGETVKGPHRSIAMVFQEESTFPWRTTLGNVEFGLEMHEPFGALDEQTRIILGEELLKIRDALNQTIIFVTHNINESVQLSDRVLVMTARPGKIKTMVEIDLPHPRDSSIIASDRFGRLVGQVWSALREESIKSFRQAEQGH